jgi:DNA polymerase-3 subunit gamma/tau
VVALYLRYRPETFLEVIGQGHVTEPLRRALAASKTHHAFLFSGPRGCGKTTSARILARCLNCMQGPIDTPCGGCPSCVELSRDGGGSLDVVEIDAASHNGVDDARELRERAVFAPARDRYKIFILDEAHMVTQQGFNALLKIVEEPPEHVKFIFATTEPEKVLSTIRSRTHHYPFRLVPPGELLNYLEQVAATEGMSVEQGVLALVVQAGGGSVRDSLSLLDQLIAGTEANEVSLASAQALLGYTPRSVLNDSLQALAQNDPYSLFHNLHRFIESGNDPRRFVEDLLSHIRDVIVIQATANNPRDLFPGASDDDLRTWKEQAQWFTSATLSEMADAIAHSLSEMSGVTAPRLQLELLAAHLIAISPERNAGGQHQTDPLPLKGSATQALRVAPTEDPPAPSHDSPRQEEVLDEPPPAGRREPMEPWGLSGLAGMWPNIIEDLALQKRSLWVALSTTRPLGVEGDVVIIGFIRRADAEILKKPQGPGSPLPNADLLRDSIFRHTGRRVRFTIGELEEVTPIAASGEPHVASWPEVSRPTAEADSESDESSPEPSEPLASVENDVSSPDGDATGATTIATRGEPVVRQLLGGELVAEELLDSMANQGDSDV